MLITHNFVSAKADGGDATVVRPSNWNDTHAIAGNAATVTASTPVMNLSQTWNNAAVTFTGLKFAATVTAAAAGSMLLQLLNGTTPAFAVRQDANLGLVWNGGLNVAEIQDAGFSGPTALSFYRAFLNAPTTTSPFFNVAVTTDVVGRLRVGLDASDNPYLAMGPGGSGSRDCFLLRDASNIYAQRNGTAAQGLRLYNTYTNPANYEHGFLDWNYNSNTFTIGTQQGGTGGFRNIAIESIGGSVLMGFGGVNPPTAQGVGPDALSVVSFGYSSFGCYRYASASPNGVSFSGNKTRSGTIGTLSAVQLNDTIAQLVGNGDDGVTGFVTAGVIGIHCAATPSSGIVPGYLRFRTADLGGTLREYARLTATGSLLIGTALSTVSYTASTPLLDLTQTWNNAAVTFTGTRFNVTRTAATSGSLLCDYQIGGTSAFRVNDRGQMFLDYTAVGGGTPGIQFNSAAAAGVAQASWDVESGVSFLGTITNHPLGFYTANGSIIAAFREGSSPLQLAFNSTAALSWTSGSAYGAAADTFVYRDAANTLAQRNSTTAQTLRVYNTFTDPSNYERAVFDWGITSNILTIGTQMQGTGSQRHITFVAGNNPYFQIAAAAASPSTWCLVGQELVSCSNGCINFTNAGSGGGFASGARDAGLNRVAPKVLGFTDSTVAGGQNNGWMQWAGQARVTADVSFTSTVALGTVTGLSVNVQAGRSYFFEAYLSFTCAAAGGARAAIAGTATATAIEYDGYIVDSGANGIKGNVQATALGTAVGAVATTGTAGLILIRGTITVNAAGTLLVQGAQGVSSTTATVFKRGSVFKVYDMP